MASTTSQTGCGRNSPHPRCERGKASATAPRTTAVATPDSATKRRLEICMKGDPSDLECPGQTDRGLVDPVVADGQPRRPRGGDDQQAARLTQQLVLNVVVADPAVQLGPGASAEQRLAGDEGRVVDRIA